MHGQQHLQARKMVAPAFAPKTALAYIPRTVELAESFCAEWADARTVQGFDGMKNFTFQVSFCNTGACSIQCAFSCCHEGRRWEPQDLLYAA